MSKFLAYVLLLSVSVSISICTMIYGWGLHPQSWKWIIGVGFFGLIFVHFCIDKIEKENKK